MMEKRPLGGVSVCVNPAPDSRARLRRIFEILMRAPRDDGKEEGPPTTAGLRDQRHDEVEKCHRKTSILTR